MQGLLAVIRIVSIWAPAQERVSPKESDMNKRLSWIGVVALKI